LFKWGAVAGPIPSGLDFAAVYLLAAALLFALDAFKPREQAAWDESAG
jgi:hypothetical protein